MISHQIRSEKSQENKRGEKTHTHARTHNFPADLLLFSPALTRENPASHLGSLGNSGAPRAAILEASSGTASHRRKLLGGRKRGR